MVKGTDGAFRMRPISPEGFEKPKSIDPGAVPMLHWINIEELVVDPTYQRPIVGKGRRNVNRIARAFSWSCFTPVVVSPVEGGKFAIIDGQHRTTAAALVGLEAVPCQVVIAARNEQAAAFKAINGITTPISRMALHAAALVAKEEWAIQVANVCAQAHVQLLRYPVPTDKQEPGQTMAVGALTHCLRRYGHETLTLALRCVTETKNNRPGALSAPTIKAICEVLHSNPDWRDKTVPLIEAFNDIDLPTIQSASSIDAATHKIGRSAAMANRMLTELDRVLPNRTALSEPLRARGVNGKHQVSSAHGIAR